MDYAAFQAGICRKDRRGFEIFFHNPAGFMKGGLTETNKQSRL
jgi:hypothetical protein